MSYFITVGLNGEIRKFTPPGTWAAKVSGVVTTLYSVHGVIDGTYTIAVGSANTILLSIDQGETWAPMVPPVGPNRWVTGVWVFSSTLAYACCHDNAGTGLIWKWNGAAWAVDWTSANGNFYGLWASAFNDIYVAAGTWGPNSGIRHYDGIVWANEPGMALAQSQGVFGNVGGTKVWTKTINPDKTLYEGTFGPGFPPVHVGDPEVVTSYGNCVWVNSADLVYVAGFANVGNFTLLMSWDGLVMAPEIAPGNGATLGGIYGVADDSILTVSRSIFGGTCRCWWYDGLAWNAVPIAAAVTMQGVWGVPNSTRVLTPNAPLNSEANVKVGTNVTLTLIRPIIPIVAADVIITVNGVIAWQALAAQNGYAVTVIAVTDGFMFTINPPSNFVHETTVVVNVADLTWSEAYYFRTQFMSYISELDDVYRVAWAFPLQFGVSCDLVRMKDEAAINDSLKLATFIRQNGIPLLPIGAGIEDDVFDLNDDVTQAILAFKLEESVNLGIDNISTSGELIQFIEDEHTLNAVVPYVNQQVGNNATSLIPVTRTKVK